MLAFNVNARKTARLVAATAVVCGFCWANQPAKAGEIADALKQIAQESVVARQVTLREMGVAKPLSLNTTEAVREFDIPVPPGAPLGDATLVFDGKFRAGATGRPTLTISLDGDAVSSRVLSGSSGDAGLTIGVDGSPRPKGAVRLGVRLASSSGASAETENAQGDILEILPTTRLSYRYDSAHLKNLPDIWTALPKEVSVLIADGALGKESYDAAWRTGVLLERAGKHAAIKTLPGIGDDVSVSAIQVPQALRALPAFAALASGDRHVLSSPEEIAALLVLSADVLQTDVIVADAALADSTQKAFDALEKQVLAADPEAKSAFSSLRDRVVVTSLTGTEAFAPALFAGRPVIAVNASASASAFGDMGHFQKHTTTAQRPNNGGVAGAADRLAKTVFGFSSHRLEVKDEKDWSGTFDLHGSAGQVPESVDVNVTMSPTTGGPSPVATIYLNDYLLEAKRLAADGNPERITAQIPGYTLLPHNTLRVHFIRQKTTDVDDGTRNISVAEILPDSRFKMKAAPAADGFNTLPALLSGEALLFVPQDWLVQPKASLPGLIRVAVDNGISVAEARLQAQGDGNPVRPEAPFIAFDTAVAGSQGSVDVQGNQVSLNAGSGILSYDAADYGGLAAISVVSANGYSGLVYQTIGTPFLSIAEPLHLERGTVALVSDKGLLVEAGGNGLNASGPMELGSQADLAGWLHTPSVVAVFATVGFLLLLLRARQVRRRHSLRE